MLLDSTLLFFHAGTSFNLTAGEYVSLAGVTATCSSSVINLGNPRDLGIGPGAEIPNWAVTFGAGVTSSSAGTLVNVQFQGSSDSVNWTTYMETGYAGTASFAAGDVYTYPVPRRPPGAALPLYYRLNLLLSGTTSSLSTGTVLGYIVLDPAEAGTLGQYPSGFSVS